MVLGLFLVAFFLRRVRRHRRLLGGARGAGSWCSRSFASLDISYLWYNLIGCAACVGLSALRDLQAVLGPGAASARGGDRAKP